MHDPGSGVISSEADSDVVTRGTDVHNIAPHRVNIVVYVATSTADHIEGVAVEVNGVLYCEVRP